MIGTSETACNSFTSRSAVRYHLMLVTQSYAWSRLHFPVVELRELHFDLVADCSERDQNLFWTSSSSRWVSKANVQAVFHLTGEAGTVLVRVVANRDDEVKRIL